MRHPRGRGGESPPLVVPQRGVGGLLMYSLVLSLAGEKKVKSIPSGPLFQSHPSPSRAMHTYVHASDVLLLSLSGTTGSLPASTCAISIKSFS